MFKPPSPIQLTQRPSSSQSNSRSRVKLTELDALRSDDSDPISNVNSNDLAALNDGELVSKADITKKSSPDEAQAEEYDRDLKAASTRAVATPKARKTVPGLGAPPAAKRRRDDAPKAGPSAIGLATDTVERAAPTKRAVCPTLFHSFVAKEVDQTPSLCSAHAHSRPEFAVVPVHHLNFAGCCWSFKCGLYFFCCSAYHSTNERSKPDEKPPQAPLRYYSDESVSCVNGLTYSATDYFTILTFGSITLEETYVTSILSLPVCVFLVNFGALSPIATDVLWCIPYHEGFAKTFRLYINGTRIMDMVA